MTIPDSRNLDSILRLSGLKNARGRRVLPGAEFLNELEPPANDLSGTAPPSPDFANLAPSNEPQADLGGELSPQSYDVRANVADPEESYLSKIGRYFSEANKKRVEAFNPEAELARIQALHAPKPLENAYDVAMQNPLVEANALFEPKQIENAPPVEPQKTLGQLSRERFEEVERRKNPTQNLLQPTQEEVQSQEEMNAAIAKAQEMPWQFSAYGAAKEVADHPALAEEFQKVTGIDYKPQIQEQVSQMELAMKGVEDAINGNNMQLGPIEEGIKQRILSNQTTDNDKYLIAAALLMPLLVGAVFGKEAGLGALGGAAGGLANIGSDREKAIREDEDALLNLNKQRSSNLEKLSNLQIEKANFAGNLQKNLPKQPNEHLIGLDYVEYDDPETGEKIQGYEFAPGLVAKGKYVNNEKAVDHMRKKADEISETKDYVESINDITGNVVNAVSQLKNKNILKKAFIAAMQGKAKGSLSALTDKILINGREVTAGPYLEQQLGFLANKYGMAQKIGQLDRAAQNHIEKIILNPTSTLTSNTDAIEQMINIRNLAQEDLIKQVKNRGFIPEFTIRDLSKSNEEFLKKPNQKATQERQDEIDRKLSQG